MLVFRELNGRSGRRYGLSKETDARAGGGGSYDEFFAPYGMLTPGQIFAVMAQRHMVEYGTTEKQLGQIACRPAGSGPTPTRVRRCTTAR